MGQTGAEHGGPERIAAGAGPAGEDPIRVAAVFCFQNEAEYLPALVDSIRAQTEPADQIVFVDDGSSDASGEIVAAYAAQDPRARVLTRAVRPPERDRLADAPELRAFDAGVRTLVEPWDVVAKLDADLVLSPTLFADVRARLRADAGLGITGSLLSVRDPAGRLVRERHPATHVRGATKFYRRDCYEQITPLPTQLGWDTIDDVRARAAGWRTLSFAPAVGDTVHLRPTGLYDGRLRAMRRYGLCAWAYGAHPLAVLLGAARRGRRRPYVIGGLNYLWGWWRGRASGYPRADPATRAQARREDLARIGAIARRALRVGGPRG